MSTMSKVNRTMFLKMNVTCVCLLADMLDRVMEKSAGICVQA